MDVAALLLELYGRIPPLTEAAVEGLDAAYLRRVPAPGTNSIGWLVWHMTRVHDHHVSELLGCEQLYLSDGFAGRFGLAADPNDVGYGHTPEQVAAVQPDGPDVLLDYMRTVQGRTDGMLAGLDAEALSEIVDERWDPPVSRGVRLISIADDSLQHVGQALYLRGLYSS